MSSDPTKAECRQPADEPGGAAPGPAPREITSAELLGNSGDIRIRHAGAVYTLRRTSKGKLILTK
jgi:hemin uptake protein HemP